MLNILINIILFVLLAVLLYIGFYAGIIKSFFAVAAGFFAIVLAENYPYQFGINYYFIFAAVAIIIFLIGLFIFGIVKFFYLSIFDKLAGACLGFFIWFVLSANVVIPAFNTSANKAETATTTYISNLSKEVLPIFGKYVPNFKFDKK
ncbi:MAG: hypothetical protein II417_02470 [Elusimicrobia bacterium]|jgi:uncharacterized membrane protein required for colicin V production|nr:hypothetical protein [Elusimicrobiota bacterium]MBQ2219643.1 hypothetical protein [Elusimicrobiota bacterium]